MAVKKNPKLPKFAGGPSRHDAKSAMNNLHFFIELAEADEDFTNEAGKELVENAKEAYATLEKIAQLYIKALSKEK